ncbi:sensor histidine kinase, partial [Cellulomonas iranensis]
AAARAREAAQRARLTRAAERARVAREMHDVVAHSLTVMVALGGGAAAALDRSPDRARAALDELVETGRTALDDVRRILDVLHAEEDPVPGQVVGATPGGGGARDDRGRAADDGDGRRDAAGGGDVGRDAAGGDGRPGGEAGPGGGRAPMAPQPGAGDLARLVERFRTAGLPVRTSGLAVTGLDALGATRQLAVYRVVQEALTNTLRHAPGSPRVDVDVRRDGGALAVVVTDAGPGDGAAPAAPGTRRGVVGMTERVAAFGGTVEAGPHGPGWRVRARLPWHEGDA